MKRTFPLLVLFLGLAMATEAQVPTGAVALRGYVLDAGCGAALAGKPGGAARAARHTKACALDEECAAAGYGILAEGKWVKFDARGDELARQPSGRHGNSAVTAVKSGGRCRGRRLR